jgi:FixJ family two-component response regulator
VSEEPTVFVVDDDLAVLGSVTKLLKIIFSRVEGYPSASEFLAAYYASRPGCLVLDVAMPGMSGLELQKKLAESQIELPVIFITGHGNVQMAVGAMQDGAINFLEKPFREQELWDSVRRALEIDRQNRRRRARTARIKSRMATLSTGERAVLDRILDGKSNRQIAAELNLSVRTVEDRRARLMKKLEVGSLVELVQTAMDV